MIGKCCICNVETKPEDNRPGTVGNVTHGYCKPCSDWNHAAWRLMMSGAMTGPQFNEAIRTRRETGKFPPLVADYTKARL